jgi:hypothetical protein
VTTSRRMTRLRAPRSSSPGAGIDDHLVHRPRRPTGTMRRDTNGTCMPSAHHRGSSTTQPVLGPGADAPARPTVPDRRPVPAGSTTVRPRSCSSVNTSSSSSAGRVASPSMTRRVPRSDSAPVRSGISSNATSQMPLCLVGRTVPTANRPAGSSVCSCTVTSPRMPCGLPIRATTCATRGLSLSAGRCRRCRRECSSRRTGPT